MANRFASIRSGYIDLMESGTDVKAARQFLLYYADDIPQQFVRELIVCLTDLKPCVSSRTDEEIMILVQLIYKSWKNEHQKESLWQKTQ